MRLTFFAFPFSLFSSLLHSRQYETDTFVLLEHKRNYKGYNYRTTRLLDVILVPIPDIVIVLTHGNVIIHQPLDEPRGMDDRVRELEIFIPSTTSLPQLLNPNNKARIFNDLRTELL